MISGLKIDEVALDGRTIGTIDAPSLVFGAVVRKDLIHRVVLWQMAKRRSGNHKTKGIGDVSGTTKKPHRQKGTGRARQGSLRSPQFRGGAVIFGPVVRDHAFSLSKRVRRQALQSALSSLLKEGRIFVVDKLEVASSKLKDFALPLNGSVLMVGGASVCDNLRRAVANLSSVNVLPQVGVNVLDLIRHDRVILSRDSLDYLAHFLSSRERKYD
jgi:large subunit ribosomal protein L4